MENFKTSKISFIFLHTSFLCSNKYKNTALQAHVVSVIRANQLNNTMEKKTLQILFLVLLAANIKAQLVTT